MRKGWGLQRILLYTVKYYTILAPGFADKYKTSRRYLMDAIWLIYRSLTHSVIVGGMY